MSCKDVFRVGNTVYALSIERPFGKLSKNGTPVRRPFEEDDVSPAHTLSDIRSFEGPDL
jgi:hypothetical protein